MRSVLGNVKIIPTAGYSQRDTILYYPHPSKKKKSKKLHIKSEVTFIDAALPDMIKVGH